MTTDESYWNQISQFLDERKTSEIEAKLEKASELEWRLLETNLQLRPFAITLCRYAFKGLTRKLILGLQSIKLDQSTFTACCECACIGKSLENCEVLLKFTIENPHLEIPWRKLMITTSMENNSSLLNYLITSLQKLKQYQSFPFYFDCEDFNYAVYHSILAQSYSFLHFLLTHVSLLYFPNQSSIQACKQLWVNVLKPKEGWEVNHKYLLEDIFFFDDVSIFRLLYQHKFPPLIYENIVKHIKHIKPNLLWFSLRLFDKEENENGFCLLLQSYDFALFSHKREILDTLHYEYPNCQKSYLKQHPQIKFERLLKTVARECNTQWFHYLCENVFPDYLFNIKIREQKSNKSLTEIYKPYISSVGDSFTYCRYAFKESEQLEILDEQWDQLDKSQFGSKNIPFLLLYGIVQFQTLSLWIKGNAFRISFLSECYQDFYRLYKYQKMTMKKCFDGIELPSPLLNLIWEYFGCAISNRLPINYAKMDVYEKLEQAYWNIFQLHYSQAKTIWNMYQNHDGNRFTFAQQRKKDLKLGLI